MNQVLELKGRFQQAKNTVAGGGINLPAGKSVEISKILKLKEELIEQEKEWKENTVIKGALISAHYGKIAAKSNRIKNILKNGSTVPNKFIVGAKFSDTKIPSHIITYCVEVETIRKSIERMEKVIEILGVEFNGKITTDQLKKLKPTARYFTDATIKMSPFKEIIVDCYYVDKFKTAETKVDTIENSIITIYKVNSNTQEVLEKIGIHLDYSKIMDETTVLLTPDQLEILKQKAPYLIAMGVTDLNKLIKDDFIKIDDEIMKIPSPTTEPTIGVIDTMFDKNVYFSEWVEFTNMLPENIELNSKDYEHGTAVSSIIVDGPSFNSDLEDGCGRFKVRHFGVATASQFSSFSILKNIKEIVTKNKDIKVWNLSLGSSLEINKNFISPEADVLDKIQYESDVIFIVAGTNKNKRERNIDKYIGAPADSINSLVVNSVTKEKESASYTRRGPVLSFFTKPDISYYGGDRANYMKVCTPTGESFVAGTSFAAPWIARKMSYLIDVLGLSREVAKALIIDSSASWDEHEISYTKGHGIVPIHINDIVKSKNDEIQFYVSGVSEEYHTYNYELPVPVVKKSKLNKEEHPFLARVTLAYFPHCSRSQGVDYTTTELDLKFGRLDGEGIKSIDGNPQASENEKALYESDARKYFRKWDNIKHIREIFTGKNKARKAYDTGLWGLSLKTKERLDEPFGKNLNFGAVVTLKEINGINRIDEFIRSCSLRGWIVNKLDIDNKIDIYNIAEEDITFGD